MVISNYECAFCGAKFASMDAASRCEEKHFEGVRKWQLTIPDHYAIDKDRNIYCFYNVPDPEHCVKLKYNKIVFNLDSQFEFNRTVIVIGIINLFNEDDIKLLSSMKVVSEDEAQSCIGDYLDAKLNELDCSDMAENIFIQMKSQ